MTLRYSKPRLRNVSVTYVCQHESTEHGQRPCQHVPGNAVDQAVSQAAIQALTPEAIHAALEVHAELQRRNAEVAALYQSQVERAGHEAQLAERQFLHVDPENRLVAGNLEQRWNDKLRALTAAEEACAEWKQKNAFTLSPAGREDVLRLATDLPLLWNHPQTTPRDRKQMLRLMIQDVTLLRKEDICIGIHWKGGAATELHIPVPLNAIDARRTPQAVLDRIATLAKQHSDEQIAELFQQEGVRTGMGLTFTRERVQRLRIAKHIPGHHQHLRQSGLMTSAEITAKTGIVYSTLCSWRRKGLLKAIRCDRKHWLYEFPSNKLLQRAAQKRHPNMFGGRRARNQPKEV